MILFFKKSIDRNKLLFLIFFLIVLGDILTKICCTGQDTAPSKYIKAAVIVILIFFTWKEQRSFYYYFLFSLVVFVIGSLSISIDRFFSNISQFFEYFFFVLFFLAFQNASFKKFSPVLDVVFLLHSLIIILAAIFEVEFLKTYSWGNRLGYISLFNSQNEFSYVVMAGILFFAAKADKKKYVSVLKLVFMVIGGLLVGTKAILLFLLIIWAYYIFFKTKLKYSLSIVSFLVLVFLVFWNQILTFFKVNYSTLYSLYESEGFLSFLSSRRTLYMPGRLMNNLEEFDFINYLFGSYDLRNLYEMSILDIPFFFGIIGAALYGYIIYKFVLKRLYLNQLLYAYLYILLGISFVAGYLMENASAQLYNLLVLMALGAYFSSISSDVDKNKEKMRE